MTTSPKLTHTIILLVCLKLCSANQNCSNNTCGPMEAVSVFEMDLELDCNEIQISWDFNSSVPIYGFYSMIVGSDNSTLYQSPLLHSNERKMMIYYELKDSKISICLWVLLNQSEVLVHKCEQVQMSDLKIIVGILAGTIFIIPCIIAMIFITYKDYHVRQLENYPLALEGEQKESLLKKSAIEVSYNDKVTHAHELSHDKHVTSNDDQITEEIESEIKTNQENIGKDNPGFVSEDSIEKISTSNDGQENLNFNTESETDIDIKEETTVRSPKEIKNKATVTLKVDVDLARQMAEADNEITDYDTKM